MGARQAHADDSDAARVSFREGAALVDKAEWASALSSFERSLSIRPHALTLYNIGVCQRFLGRYTLARETLRQALERADGTAEMPALCTA
jgi:tetratricopeptide (TPR) repeat protein